MKAVFSILKSFLALCGLAALSTALSADSRLSPVGATSAGAPGFLYSDYLQTAAASGRSPELQGSFVVKNHRPFLTDIGGQLPGRIVDEIKTLPLREWGLGYVFEDRRPAHQTALAERGWRVADWLAEETLMAATESSRGGGFIRTLEFDLQSELGGRRGSAGLNVLGALRETADYDALAWQLRGFKTKDGGGGSAGLIYRWLPDETALVGVNAFADYETNNGNGFWRWSAGAEIRTAWADLFGNYYQGITDDKRRGDEWIYTADGYDVELNVHSPDLPWLVGEITYFNWKGRHGDDDDRGFRFGVKVKPATGVEVALEYEKRNSDSDTDDGDNKKEWSGWVRYSGNLGEPARRLRSGGEYNNYEPRDYFFSPAEREYSQRIRKAPGAAGGSSNPRIVSFTQAALQNPQSQIRLRSADVTLDISRGNLSYPTARVQGMANGQRVSALIVSGSPSPYIIPTASTVTVSHVGGNVVVFYPRTGTRATTRSTVAVATENNDYFGLLNGEADITLGGGGGMFVAEQRVTAANPSNDIYRRITVSASPASAMTLALTVSETASSMTDKLPAPKLRPEDNLRVEQKIGSAPPVNFTVSNPRGNVVLADDSFLVAGTPPVYYRATGGANVIVATLNSEGGVGIRQWSRASGQLNVDRNGVVSIPSSQSPQNSGVNLVLRAVLSDGFGSNGNPDSSLTDIASQTENYTLAFTVSYRRIAQLAANVDLRARTIYGLQDERPEIVVATIAAEGGPGFFTYARTSGELNVRSSGGRGGSGHVFIPAGTAPGAAPNGTQLQLRAQLSQPIVGGSATSTTSFSVTVNYVGVARVGANLSPIAPAIATGQNNFAITAEAGDTAKMDVFSLAGSGGAGGTFTYRKIIGELDFAHNTDQKVSIPSGLAPRPQAYSVVIAIDDSGTGANATPTYTLTARVQYNQIGLINVNFDDPDNLVTVFGLRNNNNEVGSVARVIADGGFGGVTVGKVGNAGLGLRGTEIYIPASNPPQANQGRLLLITVSANDGAANDPNNITDAARATMTVRYVEVQELSGAYYPVDSNGNGQVPSGASRITAPIHTVGMAQAVQNQFTVASLSVSGGVGDYQYRQIGGGNLFVDGNGQILMRSGVHLPLRIRGRRLL